MTLQQAQQELEKVKPIFPRAWIGFNANLNEFRVYIVPKSWNNSLLINEIYYICKPKKHDSTIS